MVTAGGYSEYRQMLAVMPGEVNVLRVILLRELTLTLTPTPAAILVNVFNLAVLPVSPSLGPVSPPEGGGGANAESFIEFPEGFFASETTTLIGQKVAVSNVVCCTRVPRGRETETRNRRHGGESERGG